MHLLLEMVITEEIPEPHHPLPMALRMANFGGKDERDGI